MTSNLELKIDLEKNRIHLGESCQVLVKLSNEGKKAQVVNRRMAVGYRDNISREIFAELIDLDTGESPRIDFVDYNRDFSPTSEYVYLYPGQTISTSFDLSEWYPLINEGSYKLVVFYQADEPLATAAPPNVVRGILKSNQLGLVISK